MNYIFSFICSLFCVISSLDALGPINMIPEGDYSVKKVTVIAYTGTPYLDMWDQLQLYDNFVAIIQFNEDEREFLIPICSLDNTEKLSNFISLINDHQVFHLYESNYYYGPKGPLYSDVRFGETNLVVEPMDFWLRVNGTTIKEVLTLEF